LLTLRQILNATPVVTKGRAKNQCFGQLVPVAVKKEKPAKPEPKPVAKAKESEADESENPGSAKPVKKPPVQVTKAAKEQPEAAYKEFKYSVKCTDGWRATTVRFYGAIAPGSRVWCWCNCPYFKYHCEVVLAAKGSSKVVQANGQRPRAKNPDNIVYCCKHVYLAFALSLNRAKKGMIIKEPK